MDLTIFKVPTFTTYHELDLQIDKSKRKRALRITTEKHRKSITSRC